MELTKKVINDITGSFNEVSNVIENTFSDDKDLSLKETQIYYELLSFVDNLKATILFPKDSKHIKNNMLVDVLSKQLANIFENNNKQFFLNILKNSKNLIEGLNNSIKEGFKLLREEKTIAYNITETQNLNFKSLKRR